MSIISAAAEAQVQIALEAVLPDRCTVKRMTQVLVSGEWTDTETDYATGVPCRVDKDRRYDRESSVADRLTAEASYVVMLSAVPARWPGGTVSVRANDRLIVTGEGAGEFEATGDGGPTSDEWVREVRVTKLS